MLWRVAACYRRGEIHGTSETVNQITGSFRIGVSLRVPPVHRPASPTSLRSNFRGRHRRRRRTATSVSSTGG